MVSKEENPKSSSDTSFYMELLCESFEDLDDLDSDYVTFEKKLFDELKYKKFKNKKYVKKMFEADKGKPFDNHS